MTSAGYVSEWADQSANGHDATQTNANLQPAIVAAQANGYPVVRFDGQRDRLALANDIFSAVTEAEVFVVLKATSARPTTDKGLWRLGTSVDSSSTYPSTDGTIKDNFGSGTLRSVTPSNDISTYHIYSVSSKANEWINRINGAALLKSTTNSVLWKVDPKIGRSPMLSFAGDFAEIILYEEVLTAQERDAVLAYLSNKYNITVVRDNDGDGLPDPWERQYFSDLVQEATDDPDGDGDDNLAEYTAGTDPSDYYNGVLPTLSIARGNNQSGNTETYLASALVVSVADANSDPQVNAPVEFSITTGTAQLAEDSQGTGLGATLTVRSDAQGEATAYVLLGSVAGETIAISAKTTSGTQSTAVSFEATVAATVTLDVDGDGLPDLWEQQYFSDLVQGATDDPDGDGDDNLAEYTAGTDPSDYYNGVLPTLSITSGNNQSGNTETYLASALVVSVADANSNAQVNAPVQFSITTGTAQLAEDNQGTSLGTTLTVKSDAQGEATAYVLLGSVAGESIEVSAKAVSGTQNTAVNFEATVAADTDGDGLPDPWEEQYFSDLVQGATDDPDGDGDDNLAEYTAGTDPSDYYNGVLPTLSIASGNNQSGDTETYLTSALVVSVADANSNAQVDAPVEFSITSGTAQLAEDNQGTRLGATLTVKSDAQGEATAYVLLGSVAGESIEVTAKAVSGTQNTAVSFEATVTVTVVVADSDGDGLPDPWEEQYFSNLLQGATDDPDGDGDDNLAEYTAGTDPSDYYNGVLPTLSIASGNNQSGDTETYLASALVVSVAGAGGNPLNNAPVEFSITAGTAQLAEDNQGTGLGATLTVRTNTQGEASAYVLLGSVAGETIEVSAKAVSGILSIAFNFEATVTAADVDGDGLPDPWEQQYFNDLLQGAADDPDGDGDNNLAEYNAGTDPSDYYNGTLPTLSIASGNNQSGNTETYLASALVVSVADANSDPQVNAPVEFSITSGTAQLAEDNQGTGLGATVTVRSDAQGEATAYVLLGSVAGETIEVTAKAVSGTQSTAVNFEATVAADSDGDGLPDSWEEQYFSDLLQGATDDPDGDGDDNLAEYNAGTDPSDYYNGTLPTLSIASGNNQSGNTETYLTSALVVSVVDANSDPQVNAPVEFSITSGTAQLAEDNQGTSLGATLTVKSDAQGEATAYVLLGLVADETIEISAKVVSGTQRTAVNFEAEVVSSDIVIPGAVTAMGTAEVDATANDDHGVLRTVIMSGTGEVQIAVPLEVGPKITFYSFIFKPSVGANTANPTKLNVAGAVLDFPRYANADNIMSGYIQALDGASGGDNWIHTGIFYGLRAQGEAKVPLTLTLRLDSMAGVWDLYFGDRLWLADLAYVAGADMIIISAGSDFYTTFGALRITKSNPLFTDINKDGLPDSFEIEQGYTPTANNRAALISGTTTSLLDHFLSTL